MDSINKKYILSELELNQKDLQQFPLVEWKSMSGMRDRLIHDYFGVDYETVYNTVQQIFLY